VPKGKCPTTARQINYAIVNVLQRYVSQLLSKVHVAEKVHVNGRSRLIKFT